MYRIISVCRKGGDSVQRKACMCRLTWLQDNFEWNIPMACHMDKMHVGANWISSSAILFQHELVNAEHHRVPLVSIDITRAQCCITVNPIIKKWQVSIATNIDNFHTRSYIVTVATVGVYRGIEVQISTWLDYSLSLYYGLAPDVIYRSNKLLDTSLGQDPIDKVWIPCIHKPGNLHFTW